MRAVRLKRPFRAKRLHMQTETACMGWFRNSLKAQNFRIEQVRIVQFEFI